MFMHIIIFVTIMQNGTAALLSAASFFDNDSTTTNELLMRPLFFEAGSGVSLWGQIKYFVQSFFIDDYIYFSCYYF